MKRLFSLVLLTSVILCSANATNSFGIKGFFNGGNRTMSDSDKASLAESGFNISEVDGNSGWGFTVFSNISLVDFGKTVIGIRPEVGMNFNNGGYMKGTVTTDSGSKVDITMTLKNNTWDFPLMLTINHNFTEGFKLCFGIGPMLSIPVAFDWTLEFNSVTVSMAEVLGGSGASLEAYGVNWGMCVILDAGFKIGSGYLLVGARSLKDFTYTQVKLSASGVSTTSDLYTRYIFGLGLGYEFTF